jgi:hypothetical protein
MSECKQCGAQTSGTDYCHNCTTAFTNDLRSLAADLPDLRLIAAKRARVTARQYGGGNRSVAPIPLNMAAFQLQTDVMRFADMLGKALTLRYNRHMPAESLLKAAAQRSGTLLQRRDSRHVIAIADRYRHKMVMQLTPPEDRRLIGTCPTCERDLWCTDTEIAGQWVACRCGSTLKVRDVQEQHLLTVVLAESSDDAKVRSRASGTAAAIARLLHASGINIRRQTIAQWKSRGVIKPVGQQDGKPTFRVWDVWKAMSR